MPESEGKALRISFVLNVVLLVMIAITYTSHWQPITNVLVITTVCLAYIIGVIELRAWNKVYITAGVTGLLVCLVLPSVETVSHISAIRIGFAIAGYFVLLFAFAKSLTKIFSRNESSNWQ